MKPSRSRLSRLLLWLLLLPLPAQAACSGLPGEPCEANALVPCGINLIGHNGGSVADPMGEFTIIIADMYNLPIAGADVWIDFSACCDDIRLAETQHAAGMTLGPGKTVHATSNSSGVASFRVMGASTGSSSVRGGSCAYVWAQKAGAPVLLTEGVYHAAPQVGCLDLDGAVAGGAGVGPADLSLWLADFFASLDPGRSDYDFSVLCVRSVSPADLAKWQQVFFAGGSVGNGPSFVSCP